MWNLASTGTNNREVVCPIVPNSGMSNIHHVRS